MNTCTVNVISITITCKHQKKSLLFVQSIHVPRMRKKKKKKEKRLCQEHRISM